MTASPVERPFSSYALHGAFLIAVLGSFACGGAGGSGPTSPPPANPPVRNVILLIGDGMGPQQVGLLELWARRAATSDMPDGPAMIRLANAGVVGLSMTDPADGLVVDSACSATQLATGHPALAEVIGLDANGEVARTIVERAEARGLSTGLVSDTRITHATPAAFAAHVSHRSMENEIAAQLLAAGVDVLLSGGARHFVSDAAQAPGAPYSISPRRTDGRDLLAEAEADGFVAAFDRASLAAASGSPRLLGLFGSSALMDGPTWAATRDDVTRTEPTLAEMTQAALASLERNDNGFFLMVEGGQIDWAGHDNDAGRLLHELRKFDEAIGAVLAWAEGRDTTLVVVTADHETGGFGFSYTGADLPMPVPAPGAGFDGADYAPNFNFGSPTQLDLLFAQNASLGSMAGALGASPTPEDVIDWVRDATGVALPRRDAEAILADTVNAYHVPDHTYLGDTVVPHVHDFPSFYPYADSARSSLVGRALATAQNVVWSTGTHTHTPVTVFAYGPAWATERFNGLHHHAEVGWLLQDSLGLAEEPPPTR